MVDYDWINCDCGAGDVEYVFSMLAADKKKASETMQTSPPNYKKVTTAFPRIVYTWTAVQHTFTFSTLIFSRNPPVEYHSIGAYQCRYV